MSYIFDSINLIIQTVTYDDAASCIAIVFIIKNHIIMIRFTRDSHRCTSTKTLSQLFTHSGFDRKSETFRHLPEIPRQPWIIDNHIRQGRRKILIPPSSDRRTTPSAYPGGQQQVAKPRKIC